MSKSNDIFRPGLSLFPFSLYLAALLLFPMMDVQAQDRLYYGRDSNAVVDLDFSISGQFELLCDFEGNLFLLSHDNNKLLKYSPEGKLLAKIGGYGFGVRQFNHPKALASQDGGLNLFVLDSENRRVVRLSNSLKWIDQFPLESDQPGLLIEKPFGLAVNSLGEILISDPNNHRIVKYDRDGKCLGELTGRGKPVSPGTLAIDSRDYVYSCGIDGDVVSIFDDMGNPMQRVMPDSIRSVDRIMVTKSRIYLLDFESQAVYIYSTDFQLFTVLIPHDLDSDKLLWPVAMALSPDDRLWIVDSHQNRIIGYDPVRK
jgi:sugar lactone lactonase YvrE